VKENSTNEDIKNTMRVRNGAKSDQFLAVVTSNQMVCLYMRMVLTVIIMKILSVQEGDWDGSGQ
jgi:hypothetical protein